MIYSPSAQTHDEISNQEHLVFYKSDQPHGLAHNPYKAIVAPRPIGWISTLSEDGIANLAPYSFFNGVCDEPPIVMFSSGGVKDSMRNAVASGEFTFNYVSRSMQDVMNVSSGGYPPNQSEFELAGIDMVAGETVKCPRVKGAPAAMECKVLDTITPTALDGSQSPYHIVLGQVTGVYIDDDMITDGRFDVEKADPLMRCGYRDYTGTDGLFELIRPSGAGGM